MAKRRAWEAPKEKTMLTDDSIEHARRLVEKKLKTAIRTFHPFPLTAEELLTAWVPWEVKEALREAKKYKEETWQDTRDVAMSITPESFKPVELASPPPSFQINLDVEHSVDFLTPKQSVMKLETSQPETAQLLDWVKEAGKLHQDWGVVMACIHWWNKNGTFGACRYYFPTMMQFLPKDSTDMRKMHGASITRYKEPVGVARMIPFMRRATTTATSALLMPEIVQVDTDEMKVGISLSKKRIEGTDFDAAQVAISF